MYILLTSKFVFNAKDYNDILKKNKQCKVCFPKKLWDSLSDEAQDLCSQMLQKDAANRISASEALEHKWFKKYIGSNVQADAGEINIFNQNEDINEQEIFNVDLDDNAGPSGDQMQP